MNILAIGDVCGAGGLVMAARHIGGLKKLYGVDLCVVNAENAAILGVTGKQAESLLASGADVLTLGNHAFHKRDIVPALESEPRIIRPLNFSGELPGQGFYTTVSPRGRTVCVVSLIGRLMMNDASSENPFRSIERLFSQVKADFFIVDFHAEATSEKLAMAYFLDGRVSVLFGTHTHVPTADERVFPNGMGYITDLGMTGPVESVLGIKPAQAIGNFLGTLPERFESAPDPCKLQGALFCVDEDTGRCTEAKRIEVF